MSGVGAWEGEENIGAVAEWVVAAVCNGMEGGVVRSYVGLSEDG